MPLANDTGLIGSFLKEIGDGKGLWPDDEWRISSSNARVFSSPCIDVSMAKREGVQVAAAA